MAHLVMNNDMNKVSSSELCYRSTLFDMKALALDSYKEVVRVCHWTVTLLHSPKLLMDTSRKFSSTIFITILVMMERCKDELIDSMRVKQERTDTQLRNLREVSGFTYCYYYIF